MITNGELRDRLGRVFRELAERQFDERRIAQRVLAELYKLPEAFLT